MVASSGYLHAYRLLVGWSTLAVLFAPQDLVGSSDLVALVISHEPFSVSGGGLYRRRLY
jgi:hypothetical protein